MLEVAISSVVNRASMQSRVYVFLSVHLTFFTRLATSSGKCETNGDTEELLLALLRLEDCQGAFTGMASPVIARAGYFQLVPVDLFLNSLLAMTLKSRLHCKMRDLAGVLLFQY